MHKNTTQVSKDLSFRDVTERDAVLAAIAEFDEIGPDRFVEKYGFHRARSYFILHDDKFYDCKPLLWGAFFHQHGFLLENRASAGTINTVKPHFENNLKFIVLNGSLEGCHRERDRRREMSDNIFPDELDAGRPYVEGATKQVIVNKYERDPKARKVCLEYYKFDCVVCGFNFTNRYGEIGKDFIHVHHLKPLSLCEGAYTVDPIVDLRPVCPNCHAMLHHGAELLTIEELRCRLLPND